MLIKKNVKEVMWCKALTDEELIVQNFLKCQEIGTPGESRLLKQGRILLQREIIGPVFEAFMSKIAGCEKTSVLVCYAWPVDEHDRTSLQVFLLQLRKHLLLANINLMIDIVEFSTGAVNNLQQFVHHGVATGHLLWISTPLLEEQKKANVGAPGEVVLAMNRRSVEINKPETSEYKLLPPEKEGADIPTLPTSSSSVVDLRDVLDYYRLVPVLAEKIIQNKPPDFPQLLDEYLEKLEWEHRQLSGEAQRIRINMHQNERLVSDINNSATDPGGEVKHLVEALTLRDRKLLTGIDQARGQSIQSRLLRMQEACLDPTTAHAQALEFYVALKGGRHAQSHPEEHFEVANKVYDFLSDKTSTRLLLIQGVAGAGKSLFGRLL